MPLAPVQFHIVFPHHTLLPGERIVVEIETIVSEPIEVRGAHVMFQAFERTWAKHRVYNGKIWTTQTAIERRTFIHCMRTFFGDELRGRLLQPHK